MSLFDPALPLVAIVTPVYNGAEYLEEAMQSVQAQTYPNIVHIALDNASTDATAEILDGFLGAKVPVHIFRNDELLPITDNWDKAFSFVPPEAAYVKLHCADDLMRPDCVEKFVALSEANPDIQAVSCHDVYYDRVRRANLVDRTGVVDGKRAARMMMDRSICWLPYQHFFVRVSAADAGKPFFGTHKMGGDPLAMVRAALRGDFGYINEPLVYTRRHGKNVSDLFVSNDRTPLAALQINMTLITYFDIMLRFGASCWNDRDYRHAIDFAMENFARTVMRWKLRGYRHAVEDLKQSLAEVNMTIRPVHYWRAIVGLPRYLLWRHAKTTPIGPAIGIDYFRSPWQARVEHA